MDPKKNMEGGLAGIFRTPKTILGFFAVLLGILFFSAIWIIRVLASQASLQYLIVPILIFLAAVLLLVLIGVFLTAWRDPTILMLGHITGEVYLQYRQLALGDSSKGDSFQDIIITNQSTANRTHQLPPSSEEETDGI